LIHAAKKWDADLAYLSGTDPFRRCLEAAGIHFEATEVACKRGWNLPFGAVLGRVDVVECYPTSRVVVNTADVRALGHVLEVTETEKAFGDYSPGRWVFLCRNPERFAEPIPFRGFQGLFDAPDSVVPLLGAAR
jgi:hypothetical protein